MLFFWFATNRLCWSVVDTNDFLLLYPIYSIFASFLSLGVILLFSLLLFWLFRAAMPPLHPNHSNTSSSVGTLDQAWDGPPVRLFFSNCARTYPGLHMMSTPGLRSRMKPWANVLLISLLGAWMYSHRPKKGEHFPRTWCAHIVLWPRSFIYLFIFGR